MERYHQLGKVAAVRPDLQRLILPARSVLNDRQAMPRNEPYAGLRNNVPDPKAQLCTFLKPASLTGAPQCNEIQNRRLSYSLLHPLWVRKLTAGFWPQHLPPPDNPCMKRAYLFPFPLGQRNTIGDPMHKQTFLKSRYH